MGLFNTFFKNNNNLWRGNALESINQLEDLMNASFSTPQLIFKHSTRCNISRIVLDIFVSNYTFSSQNFGAWYLDLLVYRKISDTIAETLQVVHQSPQLIIIKNGIAIKSASHESVNDILLSNYLN